MTKHPWPLSELPADEAEAMLNLPPSMREKAITKLKREITDGTHAKRKLMREREASR